MSYVITLTDYVPPARVDDDPWTQGTVEEATAAEGPWEPLGTFVFDPLDTDTANPIARSFTVDNATLADGWYRVIFADGDGDTQTTEPVHHQPTRDGYTPTVGDIADLIRARTFDSNGDEVGNFTSLTRPTRAQVERLIEQSVDEVRMTVGDPPRDAWASVISVIGYLTAMKIEIGYFPEQVGTGRSPYDKLKEMYLEALKQLQRFIERIEDGDTMANVGSDGGPIFAFPVDDPQRPGMIGWGTRW